MSKRVVLYVVVSVSGLMVAGYVGLCVAVKHVLSPSQFARFGRVAVKAVVLHPDEGGASKVVHLAREAVRAQAGKTVALSEVPWSDSLFLLTLPGYSISLPETDGRVHKFLTFSTDAELAEYFNEQLPREGWKFTDRMGSLRTFSQNGVTLSVINTYYLTTGITELSVSIRATPLQ